MARPLFSSFFSVFLSTFTFVAACLMASVASAQPTNISIGVGGAQPDGLSSSPSISSDGRFVAFHSYATNLVASDTNMQPDVFVRDRQTNTTTRVSVGTGGVQSTEASSEPRISANGRFVVFTTAASLVPDDTPVSCGPVLQCTDIYVHDRDTNTTTRVSVGTGNVQGNGTSHSPSISGDGRYVVFTSAASNLAPTDTNGVEDAFLHDRLTGVTMRISLSTTGAQLASAVASARISTDGTTIAYTAPVLASDRPDPDACLGFASCGATFVLDRESGARTLLSSSFPIAGPGTIPAEPGEDVTAISADGRVLVIEQRRPGAPHKYQSFRYITFDRVTGRLTITPWGTFLPLSPYYVVPAMSDDGRVVVNSQSWLATPRVTLDDRINGFQESLDALSATGYALGADARTIAFASLASLDGSPAQPNQRVWVLDRDKDDDLVADAWETIFGLDPNAPGDAALDADGDGVTNLQEYERGTHPKTAATRYFAEGAANAFFSMRLATLNPNTTPATVVYRFLGSNGDTSSVTRTLPAESRTTIDLLEHGLAPANDFSTVVESDQPLVLDRTMTWDQITRNGSHAETSLAAPSTTWYLAEGATHGAFDLFYLIQNPGDAIANVQITYLRLAPNPPVVKTYEVAAHSRRTIPVDGEGPELEATDVAASITSSQPIIVERAMYASVPGEPFRAGHGGAGVTALASHWYLAEGATGTFFDTYVLVGNPSTSPADIKVTYLLPDGVTFSQNHTVGPQNRLTLTVADQDPRLADTAVSVIVESVNSQPVVVERTMWWPKGQWYEAHAVAGATQTGTRWALADGQVGTEGTGTVDTYILIANTSTTDGSATVKLFLEDGGTMQHIVSLKANSRVNVPAASLFGVNESKRFSAIIESTGVSIVVERAMYTTANGITWTAGTAALATRLQ